MFWVVLVVGFFIISAILNSGSNLGSNRRPRHPVPPPLSPPPIAPTQEKAVPQTAEREGCLVPVNDGASEPPTPSRGTPAVSAKQAVINLFGSVTVRSPEPVSQMAWQDSLSECALKKVLLPDDSRERLVNFIRTKGVNKLYHFTDEKNIQSIVQTGGLYSWLFCEESEVAIARPGGDSLSRSLDRRRKLQRFVRLSFVRNHPMMYAVKSNGRQCDPVVLEIDLDVVRLPDVLFSDRNATANGAQIGDDMKALGKIGFDVIRRGRWQSEEEKGLFQAEVLIPDVVPGYLIKYQNRLIRRPVHGELVMSKLLN